MPVFEALATMIKLLLITLQVLISIYWTGEVARQNKGIDAFVSMLEEGYSRFNKNIKQADVYKGMFVLYKIYEALIGIGFVLYIIAFLLMPSIINIAATILAIGLFGASSFEWHIQRRRFALNYFVLIVILALQYLLLIFHLVPDPNPEFVGLTKGRATAYAASYLLAAGSFYLSFWAIASLFMYTSAAFLSIPVILARAIHRIAPSRPFFGLTVFLFVGTSVAQVWLNGG